MKKNEAMLKQRFAEDRLLRLFSAIREYIFSKGEKSMMKYKSRKMAEKIIKEKYLKMLKQYGEYRKEKTERRNEVKISFESKMK